MSHIHPSWVVVTIATALAVPLFVTAQEVRTITFPISGENSFSDNYGDPRSGGRIHLGTDITAKKMTPLVSAVDGYVRYAPETEQSWGYAIYINDSDGYSYRYLHVNNDTPGTDDGLGGVQYAYAPGITRGASVHAGQLIGWVGDSGNAESVGSHLHFEMWTPSGESINSYPSLISAIQSAAPIATFQFTKDLKLGNTSQDVVELQRYLNSAGFIIAASGSGSVGNESSYFGSATQAALIKFQQTYRISPADGYFGLTTRAFVNRAYPIVANSPLGIQPGWLVKNIKYAEVFFVDFNMTLRWVVDEAAAKKHFGATWNQNIKEFDDLGATGLRYGQNLE